MFTSPPIEHTVSKFLFWLCCVTAFQDSVEFVIKVNEFKFAGGEGNTQFGSDIIDSCTYPPLHASLMKLWRLSQVNTLLRDTSCHDSAGLDQSLTCVTDVGQIESSLLKNHEYVFITEDMEQKLAEIPGKFCNIIQNLAFNSCRYLKLDFWHRILVFEC